MKNLFGMKKTSFLVVGMACLTIMAMMSCNEPSSIGVVLPGNEPIEGTLHSDLDISSKTIEREPITYSLAHKLTYNLCGNVQDPVFGDEKTSFYAQALPLGAYIDLDTFNLDSVVLVMLYDTLYTMGDTSIMQHFVVEEIDEDLDVLAEYNSTQDFAVKSTILGEKSFLPMPNTRVVLPRRDTTMEFDTIVPQLRVRLSDELGNRLMTMDSLGFVDPDGLADVFKGIKVSSTVDHASILSFNVSNSTTKVNVYFSKDVSRGAFSIPFTTSSIKVQKYDLTPTPSLQAFIDEPALGDSLCFSEGMSGVSTEITFNDINSLSGLTVNKAELILTEYIAPDADPFMKPISFLAATQRDVTDGETNYYFISDLQTAVDATRFDLYGGTPVETEIDGEMYNVYTINCTSFIQSMIDGELDDNTLILEALGKRQTPFRSAFYGAKHSEHPIQFRVITTPIN